MGNVTFLGVEGSGKTVLMMALVNLFKAHRPEGWFLRPETRNAFRFIAQVPPVLTEETLPHQTTLLKYLALSVTKNSEVVRQMDMLDYPGEIYRLAFLDAKDDLNPEEFRERVTVNQEEINGLLGHLINSDHIFLLFNLEDAQDIAHNEQNLDAVWVANACLDYLHRLPHRPRVTLLLTQADRYMDLNGADLDPKCYLETHLPLIANNFPNLDVGIISALGELESTYGLDAILERCLLGADVLAPVQKVIQEHYQTLEASIHANMNAPGYLDQIKMNLARLSVDSPEWKSCVPWFIPVEKFVASNGLITVDMYNECVEILEGVQAGIGSWFNLKSYLEKVISTSDISKMLVQKMLEVATNQATNTEILENDYFSVTAFCVFLFLTVLVIIFIALTL